MIKNKIFATLIFACFITTIQAEIVTPSELIIIPETGISFVPSINSKVFFYDDFWWSTKGNKWYKTRLLDGPWELMLSKNIPSDFLRITKNYRTVYDEKISIDYNEWAEKYLDKEHHQSK